MKTEKNYDFAGYVTKNNIQCSDGVVIQQNAFAKNNGTKVPLVWNHKYDSASNVIGHILLHNNSEGVYGYGYLNDTEHGRDAKELIKHGDIWAMSIGAHRIQKSGNIVTHGEIYEVSLVLKGANKGALIEHRMMHSALDGEDTIDESKAIIYTGLEDAILQHSDKEGETNMNETVGDAIGSLNDDQVEVVVKGLDNGFEGLSAEDEEVLETLTDEQVEAIGAVIDEAVALGEEADEDDYDEDDYDDYDDDYGYDEADDDSYGSDGDDSGEGAEGGDSSVAHNAFYDNEGEFFEMKHNAFQQAEDIEFTGAVNELIHSAIESRASSLAGYLIDNGLDYEDAVSIQHGIENIDVLFPQSTLQKGVQVYNPAARNVEKIMGMFGKSPLSRIKNIYADITDDEARARGYIKGNQKLESIEKVFYRETTPHTVTRKTRIDRDDLIDIEENGIDVLAFMKETQRIKLMEEIVRAAFMGDGRPSRINGNRNPEHIDEEHVRPILTDDDLYTIKVTTPSWETAVDDVQGVYPAYQGSGEPTLFINPFDLAKIKILKDKDGHYFYNPNGGNRIPNEAAIAAYFGCKDVVPYYPLPQGTFVIGNLGDYTFGTSRGGQVATFEQFDMDFNQQKYLTETRLSGAIQAPKSFIAVTVSNPAVNTVGENALKFGTTGLKDAPGFVTDSSAEGTVPGPRYASTDTASKKAKAAASASGSGSASGTTSGGSQPKSGN